MTCLLKAVGSCRLGAAAVECTVELTHCVGGELPSPPGGDELEVDGWPGVPDGVASFGGWDADLCSHIDELCYLCIDEFDET